MLVQSTAQGKLTKREIDWYLQIAGHVLQVMAKRVSSKKQKDKDFWIDLGDPEKDFYDHPLVKWLRKVRKKYKKPAFGSKKASLTDINPALGLEENLDKLMQTAASFKTAAEITRSNTSKSKKGTSRSSNSKVASSSSGGGGGGVGRDHKSTGAVATSSSSKSKSESIVPSLPSKPTKRKLDPLATTIAAKKKPSSVSPKTEPEKTQRNTTAATSNSEKDTSTPAATTKELKITTKDLPQKLAPKKLSTPVLSLPAFKKPKKKTSSPRVTKIKWKDAGWQKTKQGASAKRGSTELETEIAFFKHQKVATLKSPEYIAAAATGIPIIEGATTGSGGVLASNQSGSSAGVTVTDFVDLQPWVQPPRLSLPVIRNDNNDKDDFSAPIDERIERNDQNRFGETRRIEAWHASIDPAPRVRLSIVAGASLGNRFCCGFDFTMTWLL